MKKITTLLLFILVSYFSYAQTYVNNFQKNTPADTVTTQYQLKTGVTTARGYLLKTGLIEVTVVIDPDNSGYLKFQVAPKGITYPIRSTAQEIVASDGKIVFWLYVPPTLAADNSAWNLYVKSSAASANSFTIIY